MKIEEYESRATSPSIDKYAPRPKASQVVAAAHRAGDTEPSTPITTVRPPAANLVLAVAAGALVVALLVMMTYQLANPPKVLQVPPAPTSAPTSTPAPTSAPTSTPAPTSAPTSTPAPTSAPAAAPAGRGLTLEDAGEIPPEIPPTQDYIANVGAQASHSPRGGLCGPTSGDCAPGVPFGLDTRQYIANVGAQAPHKVR